MISNMEREAAALAMDFEPTRPVFELSREGENLLDTLTHDVPQIREVLESVLRRIPLPRSAAANMEGRFYRLPNHNRSFCYSLGQLGAVLDAPALVFKGCEPLLRDYKVLVEWMLQAPIRTCSRVMADHFPLAGEDTRSAFPERSSS
jgi:hypothetical protein